MFILTLAYPSHLFLSEAGQDRISIYVPPKVPPVSRTTKIYSYFRWSLFFSSSASSCTERMHNSRSAYRLLRDDQLLTPHGRR